MRMPTLRDGDYVLWESNAIAQIPCAEKRKAGLLPLDERARLDVTRWQFWDLAHGIRPARCSRSNISSSRGCSASMSRI